MSLDIQVTDRLRKLFSEGITAIDIASSLISFDENTSSGVIQDVAQKYGYSTVGIRRNGVVSGYVVVDQLNNGNFAHHRIPFRAENTVASETAVPKIVLALKQTPQLYVKIFGEVGGIVTRSDLQKPPVRMWLFGMITLIEAKASRVIKSTYPDDDWALLLSSSRLEKARSLQRERYRNGRSVSLVDCLQFGDKGRIIAKSEVLRRFTRFDSKRQVELAAERIERLRNNLAHAQDIVTDDWSAILELSEHLEDTLVDWG